MMRLIILVWILLLLSVSCRKRDKDLRIEEDKLVKVLVDIHVAEAAAQSLMGDTKDSMMFVYYRQVFHIHGIQQADFDSTMIILREDPVRLERIYAKVMDELNEKSAQLK